MPIFCKKCGTAFGVCAFEEIEIKRGVKMVKAYRPVCPNCFSPQKGHVGRPQS